MRNKLRRLVRGWAWWILGNVKPQPTEVDVAIRGAFADCGLPLDQYGDEFDLVHSGKLHEVIFHATKRIGNPIMTVKDLKELLE